MTTTPTLWRAEQQANTTDSGPGGDDQTGLQLVGLANGNFAALWEDNSDVTNHDNSTEIIGQLYDAEGNKIGGEFQANASNIGDDAGDFTAAALPNGNFVIAYEDTNANGTSIRFNVRNATGGFVSTATILSDPGADILGTPSVTVAANGSFLVAYQRDEGTNVRTEVVKVSNTGTVSAPLIAVSGSDSGVQTDAATLTNGNFVVVSRFGAADDAVAFRLVNATGVPIDIARSVANTATNGNTDSAPTVTALTGGGFVVAWQNAGNVDTDVLFQIFTAAGGLVGVVRGVNSAGGTNNNTAPQAVGLSDGGFVVVYDDNEDGTIKLQRFDAAGTIVGTEVTATTSAVSSQPTVSLSDDGRLLVGWTTTTLTGFLNFHSDVEFSILDPRENVINGGGAGETITSRIDGATVNGKDGNDTLLGQAAADTLNGGKGADILRGRGGNDTLVGQAGADQLTGNGGADTFDFDVVEHSPAGRGRDRIFGFSASQDLVHLSGIDANSNNASDQAFTFIGEDQFTGQARQLRFAVSGGSAFVSGDTDGDGAADFQVELVGFTAVTEDIFVL